MSRRAPKGTCTPRIQSLVSSRDLVVTGGGGGGSRPTGGTGGGGCFVGSMGVDTHPR